MIRKSANPHLEIGSIAELSSCGNIVTFVMKLEKKKILVSVLISVQLRPILWSEVSEEA